MIALRYENQKLSLADLAKPAADGEAIVRITLSGICNTDLEIARGYAGFEGTLGHEFVGVIEELPANVSEARASARAGSDSAASLIRGQRVVGEINAGCGICDLCRAGDPRHCPTRTVLGIVGRDGAHAEFLKLPVVNLIPVPDSISDEHAVFTEPLAAACGILEHVSLTKDTSVAVIGDGKLGLLCAQVLATTGAPVTLIGKHQNKLQIAARRGVGILTLDRSKSAKGKFDLIVEASGSSSGFDLALDLVRPRGIIVLKSTFHGKTDFDAARIVVNEIRIVGSRCGRFLPALELLEQHKVDVGSLISEQVALGDGVRAMQRAGEEGVLKVLLRP